MLAHGRISQSCLISGQSSPQKRANQQRHGGLGNNTYNNKNQMNNNALYQTSKKFPSNEYLPGIDENVWTGNTNAFYINDNQKKILGDSVGGDGLFKIRNKKSSNQDFNKAYYNERWQKMVNPAQYQKPY